MSRRMLLLMSIAIVAVFLVTVMIPTAALASTKGRKNTAIGLSAATLYEVIKGRTLPAVALGAGSAYAWHRYSQQRQQEVRGRSYSSGYHAGYGAGPARYGTRHTARHHRRYVSQRKR